MSVKFILKVVSDRWATEGIFMTLKTSREKVNSKFEPTVKYQHPELV